MLASTYTEWKAYWAFLFYLLVVAVGATGFYFSNKAALIDAVDAELRIGAASIPYLLAEDFHDRALTAESISASEDERNIAALSKFVDRTRFAFFYTMIKVNGSIHITASSADEEEIANGTVVRYFAPYKEALGYFSENEPVFTTYTDRWGTFRAALIPVKSPGGRTYIAAAEFDIGYVDRLLTRKLIETVAFSLVLLLAAFPLFLALSQELRAANTGLEKRIEQRTQELTHMARVDDLTGQYNRKEFYRLLQCEIERSESQAICSCLAVLDLDHFKRINDTWGHPVGDQALKDTAELIAGVLRCPDTLGRIGGEEFAIIFAETNLQQALAAAEKIRRVVEDNVIRVDGVQSFRITVSIGVASSPEAEANTSSLVKLADRRLYRAKDFGRNRVVGES